MGIVNRAAKGSKTKNLWISYAVTEELRALYALPRRTVREPAHTGDQRAANALLAQRRREVRDGTWRPASMGSAGRTLAAYAADWLSKREAAGVKGVRDERQRLRDYVLPTLGGRALSAIGRNDVRDLMAALPKHISARTGRPLAPRTVRHVYGDLRALYADAIADGEALVTPCTLREKRGEIPKKKDANPRWRAQAVFTRDEATLLISDERIPEPRRVLYALVFLGGMRIGEAVARRWRDYDPVCRPLGKLLVPTQHDEDDVKTEVPREVPVHPALAKILASWKLGGFELHFARRATPDEFIVPNRAKTRHGKPIDGRRAWHNLQYDLRTLGLRPRRVHDTRRTFISLATGDGADKYLLQWITHGPSAKDAFDAYATPPWEALCKQVAALQLAPVGAAPVRRLAVAGTQSGTQRRE
jgi:integrase